MGKTGKFSNNLQQSTGDTHQASSLQMQNDYYNSDQFFWVLWRLVWCLGGLIQAFFFPRGFSSSLSLHFSMICKLWFSVLVAYFVRCVGDLSIVSFGYFLDGVGLDMPLFCYIAPLLDVDRCHHVYFFVCNSVNDSLTNNQTTRWCARCLTSRRLVPWAQQRWYSVSFSCDGIVWRKNHPGSSISPSLQGARQRTYHAIAGTQSHHHWGWILQHLGESLGAFPHLVAPNGFPWEWSISTLGVAWASGVDC